MSHTCRDTAHKHMLLVEKQSVALVIVLLQLKKRGAYCESKLYCWHVYWKHDCMDQGEAKKISMRWRKEKRKDWELESSSSTEVAQSFESRWLSKVERVNVDAALNHSVQVFGLSTTRGRSSSKDILKQSDRSNHGCCIGLLLRDGQTCKHFVSPTNEATALQLDFVLRMPKSGC